MIISGILGHPLKKPRSIKIWKNYFRKRKILSKMIKFDIRPNKLSDFFRFVKKEKKFKAMAVTMPYKKKVLKYIDKIDNFALMAGAVNLIVKEKNKLYGYNTDVYGAYQSIKDKIKYYKKIIIIGLGGTGQAIFNFLSNKYKKKKYLLITNKFKNKKKNRNIFTSKSLSEKMITENILIINCTPLGSNLKKSFVKKTPIKSNLLKKIKKKSFIFDIVYSPKKTRLASECKLNKLKYLNGIKMNSLQAFRALQLAYGKK